MGLTKLVVRGARQHNLKNINIEIPRNTLTVITGLSGSGKSSLAFDTIYAEGQRRYVESLSAYARQFLDQMERPDVDVIEGLSPSIAIEQKTTTRSPRSTVGTITEIYDYLRVVYSSVGVPHCPNCGKPITRQSSEQIVQAILQGELCKPDDRIMILAPIVRGRKGAYRKELEKLSQDGFVRVRINGELLPLDETPVLDKRKNHTIEVVIDRLLVKQGIASRLEQSIATALKLAQGLVTVAIVGGKDHVFSEKLACPDRHRRAQEGGGRHAGGPGRRDQKSLGNKGAGAIAIPGLVKIEKKKIPARQGPEGRAEPVQARRADGPSRQARLQQGQGAGLKLLKDMAK